MRFFTCFGELAPVVDIQLPMAQYTEDDKVWGQIVTSSSYLPRVQLVQGTSNFCKEGKSPPGHFVVTTKKDEIDHALSNQFVCLPLSWRFKAMDTSGENPISVYNPTLSEFKRIQIQSDVKDSGCFFGIEFLLWLPDQKMFATYFMAGKTNRRAAPDLKNLWQMKQRATIKSQYIKTESFSWHGPVITICSTPFDMPNSEQMLEKATKFANPKESEVEKAEPVAASARPQ